MEGDDPVETIRMQYVEDLEDILQCPVCWELPNGLIFSCIRGHHVCENCKSTNRLMACPTCQSNFNGSRNFLAESLSAKFNDIKISILNPSHCINRRIVKKHVGTQTDEAKTICANTQTEVDNRSVITQTDFSESSIETCSNATQTDKLTGTNGETQTNEFLANDNCEKILNVINKENIFSKDKCDVNCLLNICQDKFSHDSIVNHVQVNHKDNFIEANSSDNGLHVSEWDIPYEENKSFDYAINVLDMGLIFLNVSINAKGDLSGNIVTINNYCNEKQLYYVLLISNVQNGILSEVFKGIVPSYESNANKNNKSTNIFISGANFSRCLLNGKKCFNCSLTLYLPEDF